ncbi:MAG: hypothetical protein LBO03_08835 [Acidaminococcales bacterium]|jgi:hypothetical protein|nr:hypothetical protein [Acidaminococcales bacterium]
MKEPAGKGSAALPEDAGRTPATMDDPDFQAFLEEVLAGAAGKDGLKDGQTLSHEELIAYLAAEFGLAQQS